MTRVQGKGRLSYLHTTALLLLSLMLLALPACSGFTPWAVSSSPTKSSGKSVPTGTLSPTVTATTATSTQSVGGVTGGGGGNGGGGGAKSPTNTPTKTPIPPSTSTPFTLTSNSYQDYGQSSPDITLTVERIRVTGSHELTFTYAIHNQAGDDMTNWTMGSNLKHSDGTTTDQGPNPDNTLIANGSTFTFDITYDNLATGRGTTYQLYNTVQRSSAWTYDYGPKTIVL